MTDLIPCPECKHENTHIQYCAMCGHCWEPQSAWRNFATKRPEDGESYEFLWIEHWGAQRRAIATFSEVDGWFWVGGGGVNPAEKKAVFYRELPAPPTPAEIEKAVKGENP